MSERATSSIASRVAGQGALLFAGFASAQALSFARNAILAHWLSKGDFGIAAAIVMMLQMIEVLSDVGTDRLIVQAADGDEARFTATAHLTLAVRGIATFALIAIAAVPMARFFAVPDAAWAFAAAGFAPLVKGFLHLDARRAQRRLDNRPQMLIEVVPQAVALALTVPMVLASGGYAAGGWLALAQALVAVAVSHTLAERPYRLAADRSYLARIATFGWPIWASAFPLVAVYQGDRIVIGHLAGMEQLAAYTTAFMATMVPGLVAAKVANALMLPLLASVAADREQFAARFLLMLELTVFAAAAFLATFAIAGGGLIAFAFGSSYADLGALVTWLAVMWSMRIVQATLGMALMANGITRPFLVGGTIRALGVIFAFTALSLGHGLEGAAAAGAFAELLSLCYFLLAVQLLHRGPNAHVRLGATALQRTVLLAPAIVAALLVKSYALSPTAGLAVELAASMLLVTVIAAVLAVAMPAVNRAISVAFASRAAARKVRYAA